MGLCHLQRTLWFHSGKLCSKLYPTIVEIADEANKELGLGFLKTGRVSQDHIDRGQGPARRRQTLNLFFLTKLQ